MINLMYLVFLAMVALNVNIEGDGDDDAAGKPEADLLAGNDSIGTKKRIFSKIIRLL